MGFLSGLVSSFKEGWSSVEYKSSVMDEESSSSVVDDYYNSRRVNPTEPRLILSGRIYPRYLERSTEGAITRDKFSSIVPQYLENEYNRSGANRALYAATYIPRRMPYATGVHESLFWLRHRLFGALLRPRFW